MYSIADGQSALPRKGNVMGDETRDIFVRQRRNLMAMSLVLLVADIHNDIHLGPATVFVHPPFTISTVLWAVWAYWLWRYYTSFHDLGEKGFLRQYQQRLQFLVERIGIRWMQRGGRPEFAEIHKKLQNMDPKGTRKVIVFLSHYGRGTPSAWHSTLMLRVGLQDPDSILPTEE